MAKLPDPSTALGERPIPRPPRGIASYNVESGVSAGQITESAGTEYQRAGKILNDGGDELYTAMKHEQARIDGLRAEDAFTKLRNTQLDLTYGQDNGFANVKGGDAVTKPIFKDWTTKFDDASKSIEDSLGNDQQKEAFRKRSQVARLEFSDGILRHLAKESDGYAKEVYDGTVAIETKNAAANWDDPNAVGISLQRIDNAISERRDRLGWPAEYTEATRLADHGKVHAAIIGQALAGGDYEFAQKWYQGHRTDIDPITAKQVEKAVEDGTQKQVSADYTTDFLGARDNPQALDQLSRKVSADPQLDDTRKNALIGRIDSRAEVLNRRITAEQDRKERNIQRGIDQVNKMTLAGFEPTLDQMAPIISAAKGTDLEPEVQRMVAVANDTRQFRLATPQQQETYINHLEAEVRKDPTKFDVTAISRYRSIYENQQKAVKEDPTSFAVRQGFVDASAPAAQPLDLSKPDQLGPQLQARFELGRAMGARYQSPMKPLTVEEKDQLVGTLKGASAEQKSAYFGALSRSVAGDFEGYKAIMSQVSPDDPVTAIAGVYAGRGFKLSDAGIEAEPGKARSVSDLILRGQAILHPDRKEDGSPDKGKLWPMPQGKDDATMKTTFADYERDAFSGMPQARSDHYQTAVAIYAAKSVEDGDSSGLLDTKRWDQSMQLATGGIERWNGKSVVMPWGYDRGKFKDALHDRVDAAVLSGNLPDTVTASRLYDMPLKSVGDGRYVFQAGDGVLVGKDRRPIVVDFNQPIYIPSGERSKTKAVTPTSAEELMRASDTTRPAAASPFRRPAS